MAHSHRSFYSLAHVVHLVASAAMFAVGVGARALDAFVSLVLATAPPQPVPVMAARAPQTTGLHQTRAFVARLLAHMGDGRSRAPDSVAFVTA